MRGRTIGLGLLGLGAFALVAALLVRVLLVPALVKLPLDEVAHPAATGSSVDWFAVQDAKQFTGVDAVVNEDVVGQPQSPDANGDVAVWDFKQTISDASGAVVNKVAYTVCVDRKTALAISDCASARSDHGKITGITLNFPFDTEKKTYSVYDPHAGKAFPARFQGVEKLQGLSVYRFVQNVPETVVLSQEVPGAWAGVPEQDTVQALAVYKSVRTFWVEPTSGVIVSMEERPDTVLRAPDGTTGNTVLAGTFTADQKTVKDGVQRAEDSRGQIRTLRSVLPWILLAVGVVAVLVGALLVMSGAARRGRHQADQGDQGDQGDVADTAEVPATVQVPQAH